MFSSFAYQYQSVIGISVSLYPKVIPLTGAHCGRILACCYPKCSHSSFQCQVRLGQVRLGQVRLGQVRLGQVRLGQVRLGQDRLGQVRLGWVRLGQVRLGQVRNGIAASNVVCCIFSINFRFLYSGKKKKIFFLRSDFKVCVFSQI